MIALLLDSHPSASQRVPKSKLEHARTGPEITGQGVLDLAKPYPLTKKCGKEKIQLLPELFLSLVFPFDGNCNDEL